LTLQDSQYVERGNIREGQAGLILVVIPSRGVFGPETKTGPGMNPIMCLNGPGYQSRIASGASIVLRGGDIMYALYGNHGQDPVFGMLSAWIYEEDM
jgi:hypothetical protein